MNGKAELVVLSASGFQELADHIEQVEALQGIRPGREQVERGEGWFFVMPLVLSRKSRRFEMPASVVDCVRGAPLWLFGQGG